MTSQIASIDILHVLVDENTYMKTAQNTQYIQYPYISTWLLASYVLFSFYRLYKKQQAGPLTSHYAFSKIRKLGEIRKIRIFPNFPNFQKLGKLGKANFLIFFIFLISHIERLETQINIFINYILFIRSQFICYDKNLLFI